MIRSAIASLLLATALPAVAADNWIEVGKPFPLITLPVVGKEGTLQSIEPYRGRKLMLHLFASW